MNSHDHTALTPKQYIYERLQEIFSTMDIEEHERDLVASIQHSLLHENEEWTNELLEKIRIFVTRDSCVFCGSKDTLVPTRLIPRSQGGPILPINLVMICSKCDEERGDKGLYEWWVLEKGNQIPPRLEIQYLTILYLIHRSAHTLDLSFNELHQYCNRCKYYKKYKPCESNLSMLLCLEGMIDVTLRE